MKGQAGGPSIPGVPRSLILAMIPGPAIEPGRTTSSRRSSGGTFGPYSRINMPAASRSRSMYGSPLTSTATRLIVPPVKVYGRSPG